MSGRSSTVSNGRLHVNDRFAGAMRGAVSVALVYYYYDPDGKSYDRQRSTLIAMTLAVVLISTLVFGAITKPLLDLLLGPQGATIGIA